MVYSHVKSQFEMYSILSYTKIQSVNFFEDLKSLYLDPHFFLSHTKRTIGNALLPRCSPWHRWRPRSHRQPCPLSICPSPPPLPPAPAAVAAAPGTEGARGGGRGDFSDGAARAGSLGMVIGSGRGGVPCPGGDCNRTLLSSAVADDGGWPRV
jgi:hypothetical protein